MTPMKVDYANSKIILSSAFEKKAFIVGTQEYGMLQAVRQNHPSFTVAVRQFKKNTQQEHYRGLTYDYMRDHIRRHEEEAQPILDELEDMILVSKAHSLGKRYPVIKSWFLDRYPDVAKFGLTQERLDDYEKEPDTAEPQDDAPKTPKIKAA